MDSQEERALIDKVIGAQLERVIERRQWRADFEERTVMWLVGIGAAALGLFIAKPFTPTFLRHFGLITLSVSIASGVLYRLVTREALFLELKFRQAQRKKLNETPMTFATKEEAQHFMGAFSKRALEVDLWDEPSKASKAAELAAKPVGDLDLASESQKLAENEKDQRDAIKSKWRSWLSWGAFLFDECAVLFVIAQTALLLSILFDH